MNLDQWARRVADATARGDAIANRAVVVAVVIALLAIVVLA